LLKKLIWDLSGLFKNDNDFYVSIKEAKEQLKEILEYREVNLDVDKLLEVLDLKWQLKQVANKILIYGSLKYYKDINNYGDMLEEVEQFSNDIDASISFIDENIIQLGKEKINSFIEDNEGLKIYRQYLDNVFRKSEHIQGEEVNRDIEKSKNDINSFLTRYNTIIKNINYGSIVVDGKEVELKQGNIAKYIASRDRETRIAAYMKMNNSFSVIAKDLSDILLKICANRIDICKLESYDSILEKTLFEENIDVVILNKLIESIHNHLPLMQDYLKLKVKHLNILDPHLYDYGVPLDSSNKKEYSLDIAIKIIREALKPLGDEYLNVVDHLINNGHIDAVLDEEKHQSITFSWDVYSFLNYKEAYIDMKNLIHELGHIVNAYLSKKQLFIYEDSTVFVGETASLVNEILLNRYLYDNAESVEEKLYYLSVNIENFFVQVFKQTLYTEFENIIYNELFAEKELSFEFLNETYFELIKLYYGDSTLYDDVSKIEWTRIGHLFRWNYYVYKYATGLIIASNVVDLLVDKKTLSKEKYMDFLSKGSSEYSLDLLLDICIDLTDGKVIDDSFNILKTDIENMKEFL
jgi:Oligoendopeptidase F